MMPHLPRMPPGFEFLIDPQLNSANKRLRPLVHAHREPIGKRQHVIRAFMLIRESRHPVRIGTRPRINRLVIIPGNMHLMRLAAEPVDHRPLQGRKILGLVHEHDLGIRPKGVRRRSLEHIREIVIPVGLLPLGVRPIEHVKLGTRAGTLGNVVHFGGIDVGISRQIQDVQVGVAVRSLLIVLRGLADDRHPDHRREFAQLPRVYHLRLLQPQMPKRHRVDGRHIVRLFKSQPG